MKYCWCVRRTLVRPAHAGASWGLPGGAGFEEDLIPGWDVGNRIGALNAHNREQLGLELPWVSYVGDFDDPEGLCRVYGYTAAGLPEIGALDSFDHQWVATSKLVGRGDFGPSYLAQAVDTWLDPGIVRGKGLSQVQAQANQYAV